MELLHKYGYSLVFSVILLEQLGLPIPAAPILLLAGALIPGKTLSFTILVGVGVAAALIGDFLWYYLGKTKGRSILRLLCHVSLSPDSCVRKTEESFLKHGMNSLLFAKFIPGLNTIAPPMAGMVNRSFLAFFWRDLLGAGLYVMTFVAFGFIFEKSVFEITDLFERLGRTFFWIVLGLLAIWVLSKYVKLKLLQKLLYQERITPEELHDRIRSGEDFTIVDIRTTLRFSPDEGMIPGAIRIPPAEIDQYLNRLDKERWIIMYCT